MNPIDGILRLRLYIANEGGRPRGIPTTATFFGCLIFDGSRYWDCRIWLNGSGIDLGVTYELPIMFLSPEEATKTIRPGVDLKLRELGFIGEGTMLELAERHWG